MRWRSVLPLVILPLLAACNSKTLVIESNTAWQSTITGYATLTGRDGASIDVNDAQGTVCWTVQKTTSAGTLRAYLKEKDWGGLSVQYAGDATTTEPNGQVGGCLQ